MWTKETIKDKIRRSALSAFKLSVKADYPTEENAYYMIGKASREGNLIGLKIEYPKIENISKSLEYLHKKEQMIDTRYVVSALEVGEIKRAEKLLEKLEKKYQDYKETIDELEKLDSKKSSLAEQLADEKIDRDVYEDAAQSIEHKKADLEEKLNKLRNEVIHEDYEKPF